jgi:predicted ATPase/class 3 adenylate cyclase/DNA-binding XRE family transcriptional regulator
MLMTGLPSGTVTFLFTDIEGSTKLFQNYPQAMKFAQAKHNAILKASIEGCGGVVFQIVGDSVCASFATAGDAIQAAIRSQTALANEDWEEAKIRVRMGIHTGSAEAHDGGYHGYLAMSHVQRLTSAGHGGQMLISAASAELVRDQLPVGVELKDLGEYRLKDFARPEHIYQLKAVGLQSDFPVLRTVDEPGNEPQLEVAGSFGDWLRKRRRELDLTQSELAKRSGCAQVTIKKLEADQLKPSKELAEAVIRQLGIPPEKLEAFVAFARGGPVPTQPIQKLPKNNLPIENTSFIGREKEIGEVRQALDEHRLVTLTGSGGTGKTRLSLQVAANIIEQFADGVWLIELAPVSDPELLPRTILTTFGLGDRSGESILELLKDFIHEKKVLLLLDNCEHLIQACANVTNILLNAAPGLKILATSREALGVRGELSYPVPSLSLPEPDHLPEVERLSQYEAVRLFVDRSRLASPHFDLDKDNASSVAQICCRLDGIPLAIELAASRMKVLSPEEIAERLDDRFRLLTGGSRTALPRQQTLRAMIDWSYNLLSEPEKILFRRLVVFVGGWSLDAAERVCSGNGIETGQVLDLLSQLVNKSLVIAENIRGETRYHTLETIRQYARDKLFESADVKTLRDHHLDFYTTLAEEIEPGLRTAERIARKKQLEMEHDNFRAALGWALKEAKKYQVEKGVRLACSLMMFWHYMGYHSEGRRWLERGITLLAGNASVDPALYARALYSDGYLTDFQGEIAAARPLLEESVAMYRRMEPFDPRALALALEMLASTIELDRNLACSMTEESVSLCRALGPDGNWDLAQALFWNGHFAFTQRTFDTAQILAEECIALFRQIGNVREAAAPISTLGHISAGRKDYKTALNYYEESLRLFREDEDSWAVAELISWLADINYLIGDYKSAKKGYQDSLKMFKDMGNRYEVGFDLLCLGITEVQLGDFGQADKLLRESLPLITQLKDDPGKDFLIVLNLTGLSELARRQKHFDRASRLLGAAEGIVASMGSRYDTVWVTSSDKYESLISAGHEKLDEHAWQEGQAMSMDQAVDYALKVDS